MKILFSVMTIAVILFLSSCKETSEKPSSQNDQQTQEQDSAAPRTPSEPIRTAVVEEVIHTTSYTYLRVKEADAELWLAVPKRDIEIGKTISFRNPMLMSDFKSKELERTFESVYFLAGVGLKSEASADGQTVTPAQEKNITGGTIKTIEGVHTVVVEEVIDTASYTYLRVKEADVELWVAISKRPMVVGETISFKNPMEMRDFKSKELQTTFGTIYFLNAISKESDPDVGDAAVTPEKPVEKKISVEKVEGELSIGELFAKRDSYGGKVISIRGEVVKFSKSIMGKNWVHLQDGTGEAGTNDLLVTTQQVVAVGDVVEFQGMIVLNKDFGAGYSYEVLMEMGKLN